MIQVLAIWILCSLVSFSQLLSMSEILALWLSMPLKESTYRYRDNLIWVEHRSSWYVRGRSCWCIRAWTSWWVAVICRRNFLVAYKNCRKSCVGITVFTNCDIPIILEIVEYLRSISSYVSACICTLLSIITVQRTMKPIRLYKHHN